LNDLHKLEIDENNTITQLLVSVSKLAVIPETIGNLKAALKIAFTNCPIEVLNLEMFCDLSKLRVLNFNENRIHRLSNSATKHCRFYDTLQTLSISKNLMKQFHLDLFNPFGSLQLLEAKHNAIMSIRGSFNSVAYLTLVLTKNKLKTLDLCRWNVPNMVILKLDYNYLTTIPTCLESLVNVTVLNLAHNQLAAIPQSVGNLKAALTIAITNCPIETLNIEMFCDLSKLQILNLEANRIRNIVNTAPTHCSLYDSLQTLSISQNMLKQFNLDPFNHLTKLQRLNAKHNGMVSVRGDFNSGAHLRLCLSKNQLKALDLCRWHVPNMVYLELDYNNLTTIPTCLENLPSVTLLSLSRNQIQHVTIQSFARMSLLEGLDLSYNNLTTI
ncbi:AGAP010809-PA, partial [Anopheles gambiae str. PEST]